MFSRFSPTTIACGETTTAVIKCIIYQYFFSRLQNVFIIIVSCILLLGHMQQQPQNQNSSVCFLLCSYVKVLLQCHTHGMNWDLSQWLKQKSFSNGKFESPFGSIEWLCLKCGGDLINRLCEGFVRMREKFEFLWHKISMSYFETHKLSSPQNDAL